MKLSIILPSFKRPHLLKIGLESIAKQNIQYPYEIIVINDGVADQTKDVCKEFTNTHDIDLSYYFSGKRNLDTLTWRCPTFAVNIGAKRARGEVLLLSCPEIYYLTPNCLNKMLKLALKDTKKLAVPQMGYDDMQGLLTSKVINGGDFVIEKEPVTELNTELPFCLMVSKREFINIGGMDEDFTGYCYDDADIIRRLCQHGCGEYNLARGEKILHLFHGTRRTREGLVDRQKKLIYNRDLFNNRASEIRRNVDKEWGVI